MTPSLVEGSSGDDNRRHLSDWAAHRVRHRVTAIEETHMTPMTANQQNDPAAHKGAVEGDRPTDEQQGNPHGDGVDENGMPDDPIAIAEDVEGASADESQG
jgi:hypothetical protein